MQASKHANRIIISDFSSPFPRSLSAKLLEGQELFVGGINHYRNFRNWMRSGGIDKFVEKIGLEIENTVAWPGKNKGLGKFIFCQKMDMV